jgi:hypothetical protein
VSESTIAKWPNGLLTVATRCASLPRRPTIWHGGFGKVIQDGHIDASGCRHLVWRLVYYPTYRIRGERIDEQEASGYGFQWPYR